MVGHIRHGKGGIMRVFVACEESQVVCIAFRKRGHEAFSCDIIPCSGGHPEWHIQDNCLNHLNDGWDLMIAHPPCTYLSNAGARFLYPKGILNEERLREGLKAKMFFMELYGMNIPKIAIENPVPSRVFGLPIYDQIIQPYYFGDMVQKKTCLWLKNLPKLEATNIVEPEWKVFKSGKRMSMEHYNTSKLDPDDRWKARSITPLGIAIEMAEQWGNSD